MESSSSESQLSPIRSDDGSDNESQARSYVQSLVDLEEKSEDVILQQWKQYAANCAESSQGARRRKYTERNREFGHQKLFKDYFVEHPTYTDYQFWLRFKMRRHLFVKILERLQNDMGYFQPKVDATGRVGISPLQKCTTALRVLAYGVASDQVYEYIRIGETTTRRCLDEFVERVISSFGEKYMRRPNEEDLQRLLYVGGQRGFPGMLGSIDCMCNDINILDRSPVFDDIFEGRAPPVDFKVNNNEYETGYYLTYGIYPPWATFIQTIVVPQGPKAKLFAQHQEPVRKDVERTFGVLQARFAIVRGPCNLWNPHMIGKVMKACIILQNMIVEDERDAYVNYYDPSQWDDNASTSSDGSRWTYSNSMRFDMKTYIENQTRVRNRATNHHLRSDLIENIWQKYGSDN